MRKYQQSDVYIYQCDVSSVDILFRETHSIEHHVTGLVKLLEVCHSHNLKPTPKDSDPPHAKIASDIMSCLFMVRLEMSRDM